ncbi:RluA family pseudouridine synthase [Microbulbifer sp. SSSA008]|uniref:RluA family pseudouridine synthase n=1 Tax=Microbulbifer sp. SSSA008 TaxID=3243380 RepID=UPI004039A17D
MVVVDKPSGLLSVPGKEITHKDSLAVRVQKYYPESLIVHRLDMDTSGLMVMARGPEIHKALSLLFQNRKVKKTYYAWVWGNPEEDSGEVNFPLICDWPNRPRQKVDFELGKPSSTHWKVISRTSNCSLLQLQPITGRSHQLRVHMQAMGHPILGDPFYAHQAALNASSRLLLHATEIELAHPKSSENCCWVSPLPSEFYRKTKSSIEE